MLNFKTHQNSIPESEIVLLWLSKTSKARFGYLHQKSPLQFISLRGSVFVRLTPDSLLVHNCLSELRHGEKDTHPAGDLCVRVLGVGLRAICQVCARPRYCAGAQSVFALLSNEEQHCFLKALSFADKEKFHRG